MKLAAEFQIMTSLGKGEHAKASLKYTQTPQNPVVRSGRALSTATFLETHITCI